MLLPRGQVFDCSRGGNFLGASFFSSALTNFLLSTGGEFEPISLIFTPSLFWEETILGSLDFFIFFRLCKCPSPEITATTWTTWTAIVVRSSALTFCWALEGGVRDNLPTSLHLPLLSFGQGERNDFLPLIRVLEASDSGVRVHVARGFVEQLDNSYFSVDAAFEGTFFSPEERGSVTNKGGGTPFLSFRQGMSPSSPLGKLPNTSFESLQ